MQIVITTRKPVFDDHYGRLQEGQIVDIQERKANFYIQEGLAMPYQTKVMQDRPCLAAGTTVLSSALPPAQVLPQTTVSESEVGEQPKKRGRKKKEA